MAPMPMLAKKNTNPIKNIVEEKRKVNRFEKIKEYFFMLSPLGEHLQQTSISSCSNVKSRVKEDHDALLPGITGFWGAGFFLPITSPSSSDDDSESSSSLSQ